MSPRHPVTAGPYGEPFRPQFHYTPARNWMNDPNGLVFYEGEYHLFYQYNPFGIECGQMSWGHAVSPDLLHWEELAVALPRQGNEMIYSGSAVVDWNNSSGFGTDHRPPLVAIYTARFGESEAERQKQSLAFSRDRGRTWTFYEGNPVLDLDLKNFRDPRVFWHEPTQRWIMCVVRATEHKVSFYASRDLKRWSHLDDFGPAGGVGGVWECPDLFPLPVEGEPGQEKWILVINLNPGGVAGGSGCQYFAGSFDGKQFVADPPSEVLNWVDFGPDFYAAVTWSDVPAVDGRRILLGWMNNWAYAQQTPTDPWRGAMSVPRELSLRRTPNGLRLIQRPVAELARLRRSASRQFMGGTWKQAAEWLSEQADLPATLDIRIALTSVPPAGQFSFVLQANDDARICVGYDGSTGDLTVDRSRSGLVTFHEGFATAFSAPLRVIEGDCTLRLLLDTCSLEVFAQDGETVLTGLVFPPARPRRISMTATGRGELTVQAIAIDFLTPTTPGKLFSPGEFCC